VEKVLLKDKFLSQSAPDSHTKLQKSVAAGEKSLNQLIQLAMSIYYNWDITKRREKDKKLHNLSAALREGPTRLGPTSQVCYHCGQEGPLPQGMQKGRAARETAPPPTGTAKITTGGLSAPASRWKARCHPLWIDESQPPVHTPRIHAEEPQSSHDNREAKVIFLLDSGAQFSALPFLSQSPVQ
jgi:hypothetical protein